MQLDAYLARIGHQGPVAPDLATLRALHRAHLLAIPYENIDVQLGQAMTTNPAAAYARIVEQGGRGGWCYEMNGLFGWALGEIGFSVTRMAGGVVRELLGDGQVGNHLILKVDLEDGPWIADVGFGDGPLEPYPLKPHAFVQEGYAYALEQVEDGWWRLRNHPYGGARSFDFRDAPADEAVLSERCDFQHRNEASPFVLNLVCQRATPPAIAQLRSRTLRIVRPDGFDERILASEADLAEVLQTTFGITGVDVPALWRKAEARHAALFSDPGPPSP